MDLSILQDYVVVVVLGICFCVGYVIKTSLDFIPNKYIPAIMLVLGTVINCIMNWGNITASVVLGGMISGLGSTGLHQACKQMKSEGNKIEDKKDENGNNSNLG